MDNQPHALRGHGLEALAVDRTEDSPLVDCLPLAVRLPDLQFERFALTSAVAGIVDREFESVEGRRLAEVECRPGLSGSERGSRSSSERERLERLIILHFQDAVG